MKKTTVIIPAFNEEKTIGSVISGIKKHVEDAEIIVVDDGSDDGTAKRCRGAKVLRNKKNKGVGAAVKTGIEEALKSRPNAIVIIDGDGQYRPKDIKKTIAGLESAELVLGSRFLHGLPEMSMWNKIGNIVFSRLTSLIIGKKVTDSQTGLRAMRAELAREIKLSGGYTYTQEMVIKAAKKGWRIGEVGIGYSKRRYGNSRVANNVFSYALQVLPHVLLVGWESTLNRDKKVSRNILKEDILEDPCILGK